VFFFFLPAQDKGKKMKGDSMDLRLDIERRKKYSTRESDYKQDRGRDSGDSPEASRERSAEKSSKHHKKSKYVQPTRTL
jgi:thyroid hormone receptor-associated protein 3